MFYLLWRHHSPVTEKKSSKLAEVKACGLVQQLILRMLRDLMCYVNAVAKFEFVIFCLLLIIDVKIETLK